MYIIINYKNKFYIASFNNNCFSSLSLKAIFFNPGSNHLVKRPINFPVNKAEINVPSLIAVTPPKKITEMITPIKTNKQSQIILILEKGTGFRHL